MDLVPYAEKVYIFEAGLKLKADEMFREQAKNSGKVEVVLNTIVKEIKGTRMVENLVIQDVTSEEIKEISVSGVFIEIGSIPATEFLDELVEFDEKGAVAINPKTLETKTPGLFAAGDVTDIAYKQLIIAAGEGAKAALSAYNYLQEKK